MTGGVDLSSAFAIFGSPAPQFSHAAACHGVGGPSAPPCGDPAAPAAQAGVAGEKGAIFVAALSAGAAAVAAARSKRPRRAQLVARRFADDRDDDAAGTGGIEMLISMVDLKMAVEQSDDLEGLAASLEAAFRAQAAVRQR
eukprot:CAMPEP_0203926552 /NCGR_PEP_ID=MMETSP0359-20131031/66073_1 /ASSEMBLY_ACC=CAM_ASM_000338 /TAXON_ID=268821 /ORGANISM="Scrippsiella Hangoei, Strain SHTV-5" /LENGTH=140 /DNA_ID=CAMNT_0050855173 /DNA_START=49 /DNA_END=468 /DNA_ORIENTATION=-